MQLLDHAHPYTILKDRVLWFDGDTTIEPQHAFPWVKRYGNNQLCVSHVTPDIAQFNKVADPSRQIREKLDIGEISIDWTIPDSYKTLDIWSYVETKFITRCCGNTKLSDTDIAIRYERLSEEWAWVNRLNMQEFFRCIVYVIDTLTEKKQVWGIGRGSSVASYMLYIIGVHDIDCVKHGIDHHEFFRESE